MYFDIERRKKKKRKKKFLCRARVFFCKLYKVSEMFRNSWIFWKVCIFKKNVWDKSCRV